MNGTVIRSELAVLFGPRYISRPGLAGVLKGFFRKRLIVRVWGKITPPRPGEEPEARAEFWTGSEWKATDLKLGQRAALRGRPLKPWELVREGISQATDSVHGFVDVLQEAADEIEETRQYLQKTELETPEVLQQVREMFEGMSVTQLVAAALQGSPAEQPAREVLESLAADLDDVGFSPSLRTEGKASDLAWSLYPLRALYKDTKDYQQSRISKDRSTLDDHTDDPRA
jgi:hypothetical protein